MDNKITNMNSEYSSSTILEEIYAELNLKNKNNKIIKFSQKYLHKKFKDISWNEFYDDANNFKCYKFSLIFLIKLLEKNLYYGEYLDILIMHLPILQNLRSLPFANYKSIFCNDKLPYLLIYKRINCCSSKYSYYFLYTENTYIKELYINFLKTYSNNNNWINSKVVELFSLSLGDYDKDINDYTDFNDYTFWKQIRYYKTVFKNNDNLYYESIRATCSFYRWLVNTYTEYNFFENSFTMNKYLLFNRSIHNIIKQDYYVTTFNPQNHPGDRTKICFILSGFNHLSTTITSEDFVKFDFSKLTKSTYRKLIISYILTSKSISIIINTAQAYKICDALNFIVSLKSQKNYPNPSLKYLTTQEAVLIRDYFYDSKLSIATNNGKIGSIRRFLQWANDTNNIKFDNMFFDYLVQYNEPTRSKPQSISDEDLSKINHYIIEDSKSNPLANLMYCIFHLALETEFRISQICNLTIDCIKPSVKPNQFVIVSNSKSSYGKKNHYVISSITYHILMNTIDYTESIREQCNIESLKNYIFLYYGMFKSVTLIKDNIVNNYLKKVCEDLNLTQIYTPSNLRDTHMTKAFEYILKNNKSDAEFSILSNHRYIDTTKNHYIEMNLEKMLEATYGITIGENLIETNGKIVDKIPKELDNKESDVQDGCGKCKTPKCIIKTSLPCLVCKYFITTIAHEKYFKKAIKNVDRLIANTTNKHDKEDLITIKKLYVLYLKAIYIWRKNIMLNNNFASEYVKNIPWSKNPAFAFSKDSNEYLDAFRNIVDKIPDKDLKVSFDEDIWDFNPYFDDINDRNLKIIFVDIPEDIKDYFKFCALHHLMNKTKISTISSQCDKCKSIILRIINTTFHKSISVITTDDIINEIISRNCSTSYNHDLYNSVYQFYYFLINNYKLETPVSIETLKDLGIKEKTITKLNIDKTKIPNIPEEYFSKIINAAIKVMNDDSENYNTRATACILIILSQTGLRIGEVLSLKTDQIFSKKLTHSNVITYYIHYKARKPSKDDNNMLEFDIFSNNLCTKAFNTLKKIRTNCEFSDSSFLYILDKSGSDNTLPIKRSRFIREYKKFMLKYLPADCLINWEGISPTLFSVWDKESKTTKNITIYVPESRQYRVYLCTTLYEKGVSLVYIQKYMSHLSEYMRGYYVRPKNTYQENIKYSEQVIREIVKDDITPLNNTFLGEDIKKNIQDFIKNNNLNIETDIDAIMKTIGDKVIIRGKTGGVCIKTSLMPCSKDARTNELLCSYNLCPNLFHFYYMIDISYLNFKTLQETYTSCKNKRNIKASQKELNKIKDLIRRRLIPELDELDKEIDKKGMDAIIDKHPSLIDVIKNKDDIREETNIWMKKN